MGQSSRDVFDVGGLGVRHNSLRKANSKAVIMAIGFNPGVSNAEISRISGLAPQTVSAILADLEAEALIKRGDAVRGKRGQPATPILLNERGAYAIGVEIGWTHTDAVIIDFHANVLDRRRLTYAYPEAKAVTQWLVEAIGALKTSVPERYRHRLLDLGLAMPSDFTGGLAALGAPAEQVSLWQSSDVRGELRARTGLEIALYNDGNAGCWAELISMENPRPANVIYLMASAYLGAGIVGDGALWEGANGHGADLGSMLVHPDQGTPIKAHEAASMLTLRKMLKLSGDEALTPEWSAEGNEAVLDQWIDSSAQAIAGVIFNTVTVLETPTVVIDTILNRDVSVKLAEKVQQAFAHLPSRRQAPPRVIAGRHGALAPAIGAAELALFKRYF